MKHDPLHPPTEDLFAYRDGELPPEKKAPLEAHVMGCSSCRSLIDHISSLESELRRSDDLWPAGYPEHLHQQVRARLAASAAEGSTPAVAKAGKGKVGVESRTTPAVRERRGKGGAREAGRIEEAPRLPWTAVFSTAAAMATVIVVVGLLIREGVFHRATAPLPRTVDTVGNEVAVPAESTGAIVQGPVAGSPVGGALPQTPSTPALQQSREEVRSKQEGSEFRAGEAAPAPTRIAAERHQAPPPGELGTESGSAGADAGEVTGAEYEALVRRFGLPPLWRARVSADALRRAEPELRYLYTMGRAGPDSARVRLYLAEAARFRYEPGDSTLYDQIVRHYQRAIRLAGPDTEAARIAEERLRTLER